MTPMPDNPKDVRKLADEVAGRIVDDLAPTEVAAELLAARRTCPPGKMCCHNGYVCTHGPTGDFWCSGGFSCINGFSGLQRTAQG